MLKSHICPCYSELVQIPIFAGLKRFTSILLLAVFTMPATEMHQLLKLPLLFEHFHTHRMEDPTISFIGFLRMHYDYTAQPDEDHDQDMRLPFKNRDACLASSFPFMLHHPTTILSPKIDLSILEPQAIVDEPLVPSSFFARIWQPPRNS